MIMPTKKTIGYCWPLPVVVVLFLLSTFSSVWAERASEHDVRVATETWVRLVTADPRPDVFVERMEPYKIEGSTVAYIAHLTDSGFCLCGVDYITLPVYLYCPGGSFSPTDPGYDYILREIGLLPQRLDSIFQEKPEDYNRLQPVLQERKEFWIDLITETTPTRREVRNLATSRAAPDSMILPMTSRWHQGPPFNDQCPTLPTTTYTCPVGCPGTAMAQIMYYWRWPNSGTGFDEAKYRYRYRSAWDEEPLANDPNLPTTVGWLPGRLEYDDVNDCLRMNGYWDELMHLDAKGYSNVPGYEAAVDALWARMTVDSLMDYPDYSLATYQWNIMKDIDADLTPEGEIAVATLSYHAGASCHTNYHYRGSSSNIGHVANGLKDRFFYDTDALSQSTNLAVMIEEIQWMRPFGVEGADAGGGGGHAWVYCGYSGITDPDPQFWANLGWGGDYGWFTYDNVATGGYQFIVSAQTRYIAPTYCLFVGNIGAGDGTPDNPYQDIDQALSSAPGGSTLILKAGSDNIVSATSAVIDRPLTIRGYHAIIRKQ